jgi:hypothetical protein
MGNCNGSKRAVRLRQGRARGCAASRAARRRPLSTRSGGPHLEAGCSRNHVKVRPIASLCGVGVAPKAWAYLLWSTIHGCSDW